MRASNPACASARIPLSQKLKRLGPPFCIATPAVTSGRRWEYHGVFGTILLMWRLRLAYYLGVAPARLAAQFPPVRAAP